MRVIRLTCLLMAGCLAAATAAQAAAPQTFRSGVKQTTLLEFYTAQGCSTCPPADAWLTDFIDNDRLWKRIVPVAFHVTYWDQYGWPDPYATSRYTQRQRANAASWGGEPYTPDFIRNGHDWRPWFRHPHPSPIEPLRYETDAGPLTLERDGGIVTAQFDPAEPTSDRPMLHLAVLAFSLTDRVGQGKNAGRRLRHDFVVIGYTRRPLATDGDTYSARMPLPDTQNVDADRYALAAWVADGDAMQPLQATGGWLTAPP